jgi:hypothetical protein
MSLRKSFLRVLDGDDDVCSRQDGELLAEREVFQHDYPVPAADWSDRSEEHYQRRQHA